MEILTLFGLMPFNAFDVINFTVCIYRLLAREGLNAEQLARDLKSFELKVRSMLKSMMHGLFE